MKSFIVPLVPLLFAAFAAHVGRRAADRSNPKRPHIVGLIFATMTYIPCLFAAIYARQIYVQNSEVRWVPKSFGELLISPFSYAGIGIGESIGKQIEIIASVILFLIFLVISDAGRLWRMTRVRKRVGL